MIDYKVLFLDLLSSSISPITTARHFPLPGAVGLAQDTPTHPAVDSTASTGVETAHNDPPAVLCSVKDKQHGTVECMAQEIPQFLVADLLLLFPGVSALPDGLNIITLSQHTVNDMTAWSVEVEKERDQLLEHVSGWVLFIVLYLWQGFMDRGGRETWVCPPPPPPPPQRITR